MVIERVELPIFEGKTLDFERTFATAGRLLREAAGCRSVRLGRGIEAPSRYLLLIEWDSVSAHKEFTQTPAFARFRELLGPFYAAKPAMEHFDPIDGA